MTNISKKNKNDHEEAKFQRYFSENSYRILKNCIFLKKEISLYGAYEMLKREFYEKDGQENKFSRGKSKGRIDVLFKHKGTTFAGEIKFYKPHSSEFWDATKIIAYTSYLNYQNEMLGDVEIVHPAILVPIKSIRLEHKIVANRLKIALFGISKDNENYKLEFVNED